VRRLRSRGLWTVGANASALRDAEETLDRLRRNQTESEAADDAFDELSGVRGGADALKEKLEQAGFGERTKPTAASVLDRLKRGRHGGEPPSPAPQVP
jgi:phage shock protein A